MENPRRGVELARAARARIETHYELRLQSAALAEIYRLLL